MYNYSIFTNDIEADLYGISNMELDDGVFGKPLYALNGAEIEEIRGKLIRGLRKIVLYSADLTGTDTETRCGFFRNAHMLDIENVKLSMNSDSELVELASYVHIRVVFEPDGELDSYSGLRSDNTGLIYNPSTFAAKGIRPYLGVLFKNRYKSEIVFLRINDAISGTGEPKLPEHGNSEVKECVSTLLARSYKGYFSIRPYGNIGAEELIDSLNFMLCTL